MTENNEDLEELKKLTRSSDRIEEETGESDTEETEDTEKSGDVEEIEEAIEEINHEIEKAVEGEESGKSEVGTEDEEVEMETGKVEAETEDKEVEGVSRDTVLEEHESDGGRGTQKTVDELGSDREAVLRESFAEVKRRERARTVTLHDPALSGFLAALEKRGEIDEVAESLSRETDLSSTDSPKADVVRYAAVVGLKNEYLELARELEDGDELF